MLIEAYWAVINAIKRQRKLVRPLRYIYYLNKLKSNEFFEILKYSGSEMVLRHRETGKELALLPTYVHLMLSQWRFWHDTYLIKGFDMKGKVVLDGGAGCGETAFFYLLNGARKVICVEVNKEAIPYLYKNKESGLNIEVVEGPFTLDMLDRYRPDFLKMDCEMCEQELLKLDKLDIPTVIETHDEETHQALMNKFGLKLISDVDKKRDVMLIGSII